MDLLCILFVYIYGIYVYIYLCVCPQTNRILLAFLSVRLNCQFNIIFYKLREGLFALVKVQFLCALEQLPFPLSSPPRPLSNMRHFSIDDPYIGRRQTFEIQNRNWVQFFWFRY